MAGNALTAAKDGATTAANSLSSVTGSALDSAKSFGDSVWSGAKDIAGKAG